MAGNVVRADLALVVLFGALLLGGCMNLVDGEGNPVTLSTSSGKLAAFSVEEQMVAPENMLKALVKGSIYESGEAVSVFGTCLNASDEPYLGSYANMSAWYPNGSVLFVDVPMQEIQPGYFLYTGSMNAVQGTYLTGLTCHVNDSAEIARAFGEWQNPFWVQRIGLLNETLGEIGETLGNITISIGDLRVNMTESFEITWDKLDSINATINATFVNLTNQLIYVAGVANASVDRNDSLIVLLLYNLTGIVTPPASGDPVNHTEVADTPVYWRTWNIVVQAIDPDTGDHLQYPDVQCDISSDLPTAVEAMTPYGSKFRHSIFINRFGDFNWDVDCYWS
jgi:hypothetical protein